MTPALPATFGVVVSGERYDVFADLVSCRGVISRCEDGHTEAVEFGNEVSEDFLLGIGDPDPRDALRAAEIWGPSGDLTLETYIALLFLTTTGRPH